MSENPHGDGYWQAYQAAKSMSDDELRRARIMVGGEIAAMNLILRRAQGMDAGYADAQREREAL